MRRAAAPACFACLLALGCASAPRSAGNAQASDVVELVEPPPGYRLGEQLREQCTGQLQPSVIDDQALGDVDCSAQRLSRVLRARAASAGSRAIVQKQCRRGGGERFWVRCSATTVVAESSVALAAAPALASRRPAPSAAQVLDLDEPDPRQSAAIRVTFNPNASARRFPSRAYDRVAETREPAVGRNPVGQVSARCEGCDELALRHALRVTAGRVGAGEVAAVRCFDDDREGERRCIATALEPWSF